MELKELQIRNIVSGSTGSGKTTCTNAIIKKMVEFTPDDNFYIVEDTPELQESAELQEVRAGQANLLNKDIEYIYELKAQIEKMKCGGNCKHEYWINTGGCFDQKCRFTGLDCTNCKDKWEMKE